MMELLRAPAIETKVSTDIATKPPLPIIKDLLKAFGEVADPWVLAAWFHFPNAWIARPGGAGRVRRTPMAPKDALDQREAVLNAAAQRQASYVA